MTLNVKPVEITSVDAESIREITISGDSVLSALPAPEEEAADGVKPPITHLSITDKALAPQLPSVRQTPEMRYEARNQAMADMIRARVDSK